MSKKSAVGAEPNGACVHAGRVFILSACSFVATAHSQHSSNADVEKDLFHACHLPTYP